MANAHHVSLAKCKKAVWNQWRESNPGIRPDLRGADLSRADLFERNLSRADCRETDLHGADLRYANLESADLGSARLRHASLRHAKLCSANLTGADLYDSNCYRAQFVDAKLVDANLMGADLTHADLTRADLSGALLALARLVETDFTEAFLTGCCIYGVSVWKVNLTKTSQANLVISPRDEPTITVDNLELAQFVYLLLNNVRIRDVINTVTSKVVLILGRFTPERKTVLDALREELRRYDFVPILFDFDKPGSRDIHETVTTLARLARFVVADITDPKSIPQELVSIVETMPSLPVQPVLQRGYEPWGMYDHIRRYPWVLALHEYKDRQDLLSAIPDKIIAPAEAMVKRAVQY
jgi:hypothetical protein